ncbi:MAG: hypothetical protein AAF327_18705 [Cyanobacteria bacterium P01_A01_bin.37]
MTRGFGRWPIILDGSHPPMFKYLDVIKTKTPNPVPLAQQAVQDLEGYV